MNRHRLRVLGWAGSSQRGKTWQPLLECLCADRVDIIIWDAIGLDLPEFQMHTTTITLIGGPTVLIETGGFRLLTDPTFDPPGEYRLPHVMLKKTAGPALTTQQLGHVDAVLLSHDQHADNLDHSGRAFLARCDRVLTTVAGAKRLQGRAQGLAAWETATLSSPGGRHMVRITAVPARHGPAGIEPLAGDVIGFVLTNDDPQFGAIYVTGDTVWYDGVAEVARRFRPSIVVLFAGAAKTRGPFHLTMDTNDAIETAHAFPDAVIVPVHHDGWAHFTQDRNDLKQAFEALSLGSRLRLLEPGVPTKIAVELLRNPKAAAG
jgi:L-ascorbate metabolism protein UlaG (beta-lactamase superfamily)